MWFQRTAGQKEFFYKTLPLACSFTTTLSKRIPSPWRCWRKTSSSGRCASIWSPKSENASPVAPCSIFGVFYFKEEKQNISEWSMFAFLNIFLRLGWRRKTSGGITSIECLWLNNRLSSQLRRHSWTQNAWILIRQVQSAVMYSSYFVF